MNDLNIFTREGNIPYINNVSIDKNKGCPLIKNKTSIINENTKILISRLNITESITANFMVLKRPISSLINDIVSYKFPFSLKYFTIVG